MHGGLLTAPGPPLGHITCQPSPRPPRGASEDSLNFDPDIKDSFLSQGGFSLGGPCLKFSKLWLAPQGDLFAFLCNTFQQHCKILQRIQDQNQVLGGKRGESLSLFSNSMRSFPPGQPSFAVILSCRILDGGLEFICDGFSAFVQSGVGTGDF